MSIGINLGEDDDLTPYGVTPGPLSHWAEDFNDGELEEDLQTWPGNQETPSEESNDEDDMKHWHEVPPESGNLTQLWWGYRHQSGTLQAKRYFGPLDTDEARDSPFCEVVVGPFPAKDREDALEQVKQLTT
jgi:hypothetical protein